VKHRPAPTAGALVRSAPLAAWSAFLSHLWLSGDVVRYVGARTAWIVPVGAVALAAVAVAELSGRRPLLRSDLTGAAVLTLPLLAVALTPDAELGAWAAKRRAPHPPPAAAGRPSPPVKHHLSIKDLHYATQYDDTARSLGVVAGTRVDVTGFVTHPARRPAGTFAVTRFVIWCCLADAEAFSAEVDGGRDYPDDTWLHVTGRTARHGRRMVVAATRVVRVPRPSSPYLRS
jgi:uncharacterized repeat protein (TIGR03943 family)